MHSATSNSYKMYFHSIIHLIKPKVSKLLNLQKTIALSFLASILVIP